jgi:hypothetical protein
MRLDSPPFQAVVFTTTRDRPTDLPDGSWITVRTKPPLDGWTIAQDRERSTVWSRRTGVAWTRAPSIMPSTTPGRR